MISQFSYTVVMMNMKLLVVVTPPSFFQYSNKSSMVINLRGLDKYESNHTNDGQTDRKTRTEVT